MARRLTALFTAQPLYMAIRDAVVSGDGRPTVLVVDDSPTDRLLFRHALRRWFPGRLNIVCVESGEEAVALITQRSPDIVVTDLFMPGPFSGRDVARHARRKGLPAFIASAAPAAAPPDIDVLNKLDVFAGEPPALAKWEKKERAEQRRAPAGKLAFAG